MASQVSRTICYMSCRSKDPYSVLMPSLVSPHTTQYDLERGQPIETCMIKRPRIKLQSSLNHLPLPTLCWCKFQKKFSIWTNHLTLDRTEGSLWNRSERFLPLRSQAQSRSNNPQSGRTSLFGHLTDFTRKGTRFHQY